MAITNSDGSIILTTKVDTGGLKKGMSQIEGKAAGLKGTFLKLATAIATAFSVQKIIQFSNEAGQLATQTEASVQRLVDIYGSASDSVGDFIDANARALGMSKAAATSFSSVYGNLFSVWADQGTNAELTNRYLNMTAVVASKTGRTVEDVQERVRSGLLGNTEAIEDLGIFVNVKTIEMTDAFQRMAGGKSWEQLDAYTQQQIRSMAILEQATAKYGDEVADTSATIRNRFNAAYQDFQNSWGNIVNRVLLPVLETVTQILDIMIVGLNALSGQSGNALEIAESQKDSTNKTAENINKQAEAEKDLNKEMKKTLAGFDDIQILSSQTAQNTTNLGNIEKVDFDKFDGADYEQEISETLLAIMAVVEIALVAVGLILMFTGNIAWGVGFIIAGATTLGITVATVATTDVGNDVIQMLLTIMGVASGAMLAIGIILCKVGSIPLGVGFIVAGAASLIGTMAALIGLNPNDIATWLSVITGIAGGAMLALGIMLCWLVGPTPLAIGLIVAGAGSLATAVALNTDAVRDWLEKAWRSVTDFWDTYIAPIFTAKFWFDLGKNSLNGLITAFELAINTITSGLRSLANMAISVLNSIGGAIGIDFNIPQINSIKLPRLAQGAVIPPNREFLAVLGDQKHGTNIEAPLQTIVDAFNIALSQNNGYSGGNTEVILEIDGREFGRAVVEQGNRENRRIGTRLVIA